MSRLRVDVFDTNDVKVATVYDIISVTIGKALDGAGTFAVTFPVDSDGALNAFTQECRVRGFWEEDGQVREVGRGVLRKRRVSESGSAAAITMSGADSLDALTRKNVLLGRIYTDEPIVNIASDLVSLVPGWSILVDDGLGNQTDRFDGVSVLKALISLAQKKNLHLREGLDPNTLELGAFGDNIGVTAIKPGSMTFELNYADELVLVESITQNMDSSKVVNWVIPLGGGEGTAQLTLANSTRTSPYTIYSLTGPDGRTLYYLQDDNSIALYGEIQGPPLLYKDINPVANSDSAKELAANALYDAAVADLQNMAVAQETYSITVRKPRTVIRTGDQIRLIYKGVVPVQNDTALTYIDVNGMFWVLGVKETISDSGDSLTLDISNVSRKAATLGSTVGKLVQEMNVRNVNVQPVTCVFQDSSERPIQAGAAPHYKEAIFGLRINEIFTDITRVVLHFTSRPLISYTGMQVLFGSSQWNEYYAIYESAWYPVGVHLFIDGVDVSTALGGPWNPSPGNSPIDAEVDITSYIVGSGSLYQNHSIVFKALDSNLQNGEVIPAAMAITEEMSSGFIECKTLVVATTQGIITS